MTVKNKIVYNLAKKFGREIFEIFTLKNVIFWPRFTNFKQYFVNFVFKTSTAVVSHRRRIDASARRRVDENYRRRRREILAKKPRRRRRDSTAHISILQRQENSYCSSIK